MDKKAIIRKHKELLEQDKSKVLMNPLKEDGDGYIVYGEFFINKNEVTDLADLLLELLDK